MKTTAGREGGVSRKRRSNALELASHCGAELYGVVRCGFVAEKRGSGGAIPTNRTVVVAFQNAERRRSSTLESPAPVVRGTRSRPVNGGRLCETEAHWHRRDIPCGDTKELGIAAPDLPVRCAPGDHAISWPEFVDIRPSSLHDARGIQTGDEWKVDLSIPIARACAVACACFGVGWIDTCIADPDQNLAILWLRDRQVPQAHHIWITIAVKNHRAHRQYHLHPV